MRKTFNTRNSNFDMNRTDESFNAVVKHSKGMQYGNYMCFSLDFIINTLIMCCAETLQIAFEIDFRRDVAATKANEVHTHTVDGNWKKHMEKLRVPRKGKTPFMYTVDLRRLHQVLLLKHGMCGFFSNTRFPFFPFHQRRDRTYIARA